MASDATIDDLRLTLAAHCRSAVETLLERPLTTGTAGAAGGAGWSTPVTVSGGPDGTLAVWFDEAGVRRLAQLLGLDETSEPDAIASLLGQIWSQAAAALAADTPGLTCTVGQATPAAAPAAAAMSWLDGATVVGTIAVTGESRAPQAIVAADLHASGAYPGNLASILEVDLPLVARFARTEMPLRALAQLGPGSMVDMGRSPDAPVQLLVGGQVIAEGEVVVVKGNYGVRITSLVSPADRLRAIQL